MKVKFWLGLLLVWVSLLLLPVARAAELPQRAQLQFVDSYGLPVSMDFVQQGDQYRINTQINLIFYQMQFVSTGTVNGSTLNPLSYIDSRYGKPYAQARFTEQGIDYGKVSEASKHMAVNGPVYDMFALGWQLGFNHGKLPANTYLTNGKKVYLLDEVRSRGNAQLLVNGRQIDISQYSISRGDNVVEYAFAPQFENIPVQISYMDNGKVYTLQLKGGQIDGKAI
ncbi:hypothetical protein BHC44_06980 [Snodgrassella alvi]|jgi:hypothetical protein|uniref:DUF3108 domain-containing protein n=1 Tax=Snodgrassella alvi TaxID=1196083 RepID=A0A2N9Y0W6_9NEIS|nr:DUF3108 domain-containing protein [Snodgrassella alvi]PIT52679.1 hypothetical protein BHC44_06980 [Snodgrassella alvi]PIT58443.1 hypothetical protein BHC49_01255 [Snodgrassella alvi]